MKNTNSSKMIVSLVVLGTIALGFTATSTAFAQPRSGPSATGDDSSEQLSRRPWAEGVSPEQEREAFAAFNAGNEHLTKLRYSEAAASYRDALVHWDHPAINFNLTIALIHLGELVDAYETVERALRYGSVPLESKQYEQAVIYRALLRRQVAYIEIVCKQPGVSVQLDGQVYMTGPGSIRKVILPGYYQIVATRRGYEKVAHRELLLPGESKKVQLTLFTAQELTQRQRRWSAWKPWALVGTGLAIASIGGVWQWRAKAGIDEFDNDDYPESCPEGCKDQDSALKRALRIQDIGIGHYAVGSAVVTAGLVLAYINRPREERFARDDKSVRITIQPTLSPGGPGAAVIGSF